MNRSLALFIFGLSASLCWGSGDFNGGLAARRSNSTSVVISAYSIGFVLLVALALIWHEPFPSLIDIFWGAIGGIAGGIGLVTFYSALSSGSMGIVAPVSAILTAALPVLFSILTQGLPGWIQICGFVLALCAILLISRPEKTAGRPKGIALALVAGGSFGCFFILISRISPTATYWPLAIARLTSIVSLLLMAGIRKQSIIPTKSALLPIILAGILDSLGNAFFVLAAHTGRLDIAAILASLYPAATVILAATFLHERVTRVQTIGIVLALLAIPFISI